MSVQSTTAGVLLAAGRGRRMGSLKQVLPWGGTTVVAAAFDALAPHCGAGMGVVVGDDADDADAIAAALAPRPFEAIPGDSDAEQIVSVRRGLAWAATRGGVQRVALHLADHPVIPRCVLPTLLERAERCAEVLIPTHRDRGGHPIIVPADLAASIVAGPVPESGGLRALWRRHAARILRIEFPEASELLLDLDSPEDYESARPR